jgi:hypothetical protein
LNAGHKADDWARTSDFGSPAAPATATSARHESPTGSDNAHYDEFAVGQHLKAVLGSSARADLHAAG